MEVWLIAGAVFLGVTLLVGAVAMIFRGDGQAQVEHRLDVMTNPELATLEKYGVLKKDPAGEEEDFSIQLDDETSFLEEKLKKFTDIRMLFRQADTKLKPTPFFLLTFVLFFLPFAGCFYKGIPLIWSLGVALFVATLPFLYLLWKRKKRFALFSVQLIDALELMARALRSGNSLAFAIESVAQNMPNPISGEFSQVYEEQNLGVPLEEALASMTERIPGNLDLQFFCTAVALQRQTGGDLAEILDKISGLIRERVKIWGMVQALTGEGRISGVILLALPPLLFVVLYRLNPEYMSVLFTEPLGRQMIGYALIMQLFGAIAIKKIITIKV